MHKINCMPSIDNISAWEVFSSIYPFIVHFTREIKDMFNKKHLNFLFIIYKFPIIF